VIPFLGQTLLDSDQAVWRQALDGLAAFASPEAIQAIRSAKSRHFSNEEDKIEYIQWLDEAIEQITRNPL
jgi:HEAT repeat protein